jgi:hypothetical protein
MWSASISRLIKPMILTGLSDTLVKALTKISQRLPSTVPLIQQHLLLPVLAALPLPVPSDKASGRSRDAASRRSHYHVKASILKEASMEEFARQVQTQVAAQLDEDGRSKKLTRTALDTLRHVDFGQHMLLGFTKTVLLVYACSEDENIRKSAALAAWRVTDRQWKVLKCVHSASG